MAIKQIIVGSRLSRKGIRKKFSRTYPRLVVTKMRVFPSFKGRKGVAVTYKKRKKKRR